MAASLRSPVATKATARPGTRGGGRMLLLHRPDTGDAAIVEMVRATSPAILEPKSAQEQPEKGEMRDDGDGIGRLSCNLVPHAPNALIGGQQPFMGRVRTQETEIAVEKMLVERRRVLALLERWRHNFAQVRQNQRLKVAGVSQNRRGRERPRTGAGIDSLNGRTRQFRDEPLSLLDTARGEGSHVRFLEPGVEGGPAQANAQA